MKTFLLWLSLGLTLTSARSATLPTTEPAGIKFFTGSWKDVLAEAKRQNKPVFVDIYTTWCGPCKLMAKQAFPDPKVGEKFNANFISYQIDAEKGEGIQVAKKYAVDAYPTSLYVAADGNLIHRAIGYGGIKGMLDEADKAIEAAKDPNPLSAMEQEYKSGKRDAKFLAAYLAKRGQVGAPDGEALDAYLKALPEAEWSSETNLKLISGNLTTANSKGYDVLFNKLSTNAMTPTGRQAMMGLQKALQNDFKRAIDQKSEAELDGFIQRSEKLGGFFRPLTAEMKEQAGNSYRMRFYQQTKNTDKYRALASAEAGKLMAVSVDSVRAKNDVAYKRFQQQTAMMPDSVKNQDNFKQYAESMKTAETGQMAMKLNGIAWGYYETMTDPKDLNQALTWSAKSLDYNRDAMYLDTYANLLSKLGRKAEAVKTQQEAIAKLKAAGKDTADYEKTLTEMKQK